MVNQVADMGSHDMSDQQDSEHFRYDKTWEDIEHMLDLAERRYNIWLTVFYEAQTRRDKKVMANAARNKKALEGVIKTLRWTLGDIEVKHPLE